MQNYTINSEFSKCLNTLYKTGNPYATRNEDFVCAKLQEPHYKFRIDGPSYDMPKVCDRINSLMFLNKSNTEIAFRCNLGMGQIRITLTDELFVGIFKDAVLSDLKAREHKYPFKAAL
jgi:hypothetical protein